MKYVITLLLAMPLMVNAQDTSKYATLLAAYRLGHKNYTDLPELAHTAKSKQEDKLADSIGQDYTDHYLSKLNGNDFLTKENLQLFYQFNRTSKNRAFQIFYLNTSEVDEIMGKSGFAQKYIDGTIYWENIRDNIWEVEGKVPIDKPDWVKIKQNIKKKYNGEYAERTVLAAQFAMSEFKKDSVAIFKYGFQKFDKYGFDVRDPFALNDVNNFCYFFIFEHCDEREILEKAVSWMKEITATDPGNANYLDTYADLLYKLNKPEGIQFEAKAIQLSNGNNQDIKTDYDKMKSGIPFWSTVSY